jgi:hypothetical protein
MTPNNPQQLAVPTLPSTTTTALQMPVFGSFNSKPKAKPQQASFLGAAATPQAQNLGTKTLLGA